MSEVERLALARLREAGFTVYRSQSPEASSERFIAIGGMRQRHGDSLQEIVERLTNGAVDAKQQTNGSTTELEAS